MKKVTVITLLMTVIAATLIGASVCYADGTSGSSYYYVKEISGKEIPLYRASAIEGNGVLVYIPSGYAFEYLENAGNSSYVKVRYNGLEGYINSSDFDKNCAKVTSPAWEGKYAYAISPPAVTPDSVAIFKKDDINQAFGSAQKSSFSIDKVYGYYHKENESTYYFLIDFTVSNFGQIKDMGYIKASDTSIADFSHTNIRPGAGYDAETKVDDTLPSGGDPNSNEGNPPDGTTKPPTNNLERYILIAVIAVLCVVIIILIFAPNKSKRGRSDM